MSTKEEGYKEVQLGPETLNIAYSWDLEELDKHIKVLTGDSFSSNKFNEESKGIPLIRIRNLNDENTNTFYNGEYDKKYLIDEESILIGMDGAFHTVWWPSATPALLNQRVAKVTVSNQQLNSKFLFYQLIGEIKKIEARTPATTVKHLSKKDINHITIPLPKYTEQKKIAEVLSTVDDAIQKTEEIIERTKELKKGLMQDLLTKGIGHEEFKEVKLGPRKVKIPATWETNLIKEEDIELADGNYSSKYPSSSDFVEKEGIPFISAKDISSGKIKDSDLNFISESKHESLQKGHLEFGDVLLTVRGEIGKTAIVENEHVNSNINAQVALLRPKSRKINSSFLQLLFESEVMQKEFRRIENGTTLKQLSITELKKLRISIPAVEEQEKIAEILTAIVEKIQQEQEYKEKLGKLKKGLMQDLLTGKVRVLPLLSDEEKEELKEANVPG